MWNIWGNNMHTCCTLHHPSSSSSSSSGSLCSMEPYCPYQNKPIVIILITNNYTYQRSILGQVASIYEVRDLFLTYQGLFQREHIFLSFLLLFLPHVQNTLKYIIYWWLKCWSKSQSSLIQKTSNSSPSVLTTIKFFHVHNDSTRWIKWDLF